MHKVYRHGHFNISATAATDSSEGLYVQRDQVANGHAHVDLLVGDTAERAIPCIAFDPAFLTEQLPHAPLNKRGWVVQERVLSKRVLHFGQQLFWECREMSAMETFRQGIPAVLSSDQSLKCLDPAAMDDKVTRSTDARKNLRFRAYDIWTRIASTYSRCSLTKPEDKLPAIMGIAKHIQPLVDDIYIAGMWRRYLASELAWKVNSAEPERSRPETFIAPTWSWMSLDAGVQCRSVADEGVLFKIKDVQLEYATEDSIGPLESGRLYVEGLIRRINLKRRLPALFHTFERHARDLTFPDHPDSAHFKDDSPDPDIDVPPNDFDKEHTSDLLFGLEILESRGRDLKILLLRCENR